MKTLLLIRHAKSSWDDAALNDFDRPLNERGKKDASEMANRIARKRITIDALISSPAKRAAKTAKIFSEELQIKKEEIIFKSELYLAPVHIFSDTIKNTNDALDCISIVAHNPGITDFANELTEIRIDNIPTCGLFAVKADINHWKDFKGAPKKFWFFDFPKAGS